MFITNFEGSALKELMVQVETRLGSDAATRKIFVECILDTVLAIAPKDIATIPTQSAENVPESEPSNSTM